jgi:hypothetical protein
MLESSVIDEKYFSSKIPSITYPYGLTKKLFCFYPGDAEDIIILKVDDKGKIETILRKKDDRILNIIRNIGFERRIKKELSKVPTGEYVVDVKLCEIVYNLNEKTEINWFNIYPQLSIFSHKDILVIGTDTENKKESLYFIENAKICGLFDLVILQSRSLSMYKPKDITEFGSGVFCKLIQKRLNLDGTISVVNFKDYMIPSKELSNLSGKHIIKLTEFLDEIKNEINKNKKLENTIYLSEIIRSGFIPKVEKDIEIKIDSQLPAFRMFTSAEISTDGWLVFKTSCRLEKHFYDSTLASLRETIGIEEIAIIECLFDTDTLE